MKSSKEIVTFYHGVGAGKVRMPLDKMFLSAFFAGMFIALGGVGSQLAGFYTNKVVGAFIFPVGLTLVLAIGTELFTGNCLLLIPAADGKIGWGEMLKSWIVVYLGNFAGALFTAFMVRYGGIFPEELMNGAISTAAAKVHLDFATAFIRAIGCNILVCIAVWMGFINGDLAGKVIGLYLPTMLFVLCGFEHCVANMYFIPLGIMAGEVSVAEMLITNLVPVTLGNIVGGGVIVGLGFRYLYGEKKAAS